MSVRLNVGDAVLVNTNQDSERIGVIKYIGCIHGCDMTTEYVGIELTESIHNGHNGTIAGYQYFSSPNGHGFHTKLASVIRKMLPSELVTKLRNALTSFKKQISDKEKYIERLESKINSRTSHIHQYDLNLAGSSKRTSLVSGASGYLPRRESLSLTTITENFMPGYHMHNKRESVLNVIEETRRQMRLKNRARSARRSKSHQCLTPLELSDHECSSSESGYSSSSTDYTEDEDTLTHLSDGDEEDEEFSNNTMNTMKRRQSSQKSLQRNNSQQSVHDEKKVGKKFKKLKRKIRKKIGARANMLKDRRKLRRISDSSFRVPTIAMQRRNSVSESNTNTHTLSNSNSVSQKESMVQANTNMQQMRNNQMTHNHAHTPSPRTVHNASHDSLPPNTPSLMRPSSSPVFKRDCNNKTHPQHARFKTNNLSPRPHINISNNVMLDSPSSPSHTLPHRMDRNHTHQQSSGIGSGFVDVCYNYHAHNNQSSSYQFAAIQSMRSLHSNQSSTTIDLWSNPHHNHHISTSSPSSVPHTPQHVDNGNIASETQSAYFDADSFLNQRNQMIMQQQQQKQKKHQIPSYPVVSIKYNSLARAGQRSNIQSVRNSPTRTSHAISNSVAANVALYGADSRANNAQQYAHHKIYSLPNTGLHIFGNNYKGSQSNTLSK